MIQNNFTVREKLAMPVTCVIRRENGDELILQSSGIKPLMETYTKTPEALKNAQIADKIIGKAAAAILILGGVVYAYGEVMSEGGAALLSAHGVTTEHGTLVKEIRNRQDTGCCPMEAIAAPHETPNDIYDALCAFFCEKTKI